MPQHCNGYHHFQKQGLIKWLLNSWFFAGALLLMGQGSLSAARPAVGVFPFEVPYPKSDWWIGYFIQEELSRQLVLSEKHSVLPPETAQNWKQHYDAAAVSQFSKEQLQEMMLQYTITGTLQKVLAQSVIHWTFTSVIKNQLHSKSVQTEHTWTTPDALIDALISALKTVHVDFKYLKFYPKNYSWEGLEVFYLWKHRPFPLPHTVEWEQHKNQLESYLSLYPAVSLLVHAQLAEVLLTEYNATSQHVDKKSLDKAEHEINQSLQSDPTNDRYRTILSLIHFLKNDKSLAKSEAVIANAKNAYNGLAWILYGLTIGKHPRDGQVFIERGLKFHPFLTENAPVYRPFHVLLADIRPWLSVIVSSRSSRYKEWYELGRTQFGQRLWPAAYENFQKALTADPTQFEPQLYLARIELQQKEYPQALDRLSELRKKYPDEDQVPFYLGILKEQLNFYKEAEVHYREALTLKPSHPTALLRLAALLIRNQQYEDAQSFLESLTRKYPGYVDAWIKLGRVYFLLNQKENARLALEEALRLDPENVRVKKFLQTMSKNTKDPQSKP